MILKRYGRVLHSVRPNFDSRAMTEIGFRRDRRRSFRADEFEAAYEATGVQELSARAEGPVHDEAEAALLERLEAELLKVEGGVGQGGLIVIESKQGLDYPKTRDRKQNRVVDGHNRLYFHWTVRPPLRVGTYRLRAR